MEKNNHFSVRDKLNKPAKDLAHAVHSYYKYMGIDLPCFNDSDDCKYKKQGGKYNSNVHQYNDIN